MMSFDILFCMQHDLFCFWVGNSSCQHHLTSAHVSLCGTDGTRQGFRSQLCWRHCPLLKQSLKKSLFKKPSTEVNPKLPASDVVAFCTLPPVMAVQQCFGWHIRVNMHIFRGLIPDFQLYLSGSAMKCQLTAHIIKYCVQRAVSCISGCQKSELAFLTNFWTLILKSWGNFWELVGTF